MATTSLMQDKVSKGKELLFFAMSRYDEKIGALASEADRLASSDPAISAIKFRVFGELLAGEVGSIKKKLRRGGETADLYLKRLQQSRCISDRAANSFHEIRKIGNSAAHGDEVTEGDAREVSKHAAQVIEWFLGRYAKDHMANALSVQSSSFPRSKSPTIPRKPSKAEVLAMKLRSGS